tara:strand:+ start:352 stop:855 length:504 start_codon:yes stop_codon:yes gene_type:complete
LEQIKMNAGNFMLHSHPRGGDPRDDFNADLAFNLICCYRKAIAHQIKAYWTVAMIGKRDLGAVSEVLGNRELSDSKIVSAPKDFFEAAAKLNDLSQVPTIDYDSDRFRAVFRQALQFSPEQVKDVIAGTEKPIVSDHRNGSQVELTLDNFEGLINPDGADDASSLDA